MYVLSPRVLTDSSLDSSIPEPDVDQGEIEWSAGSYNAGDERILVSTHRRYRAATTTTDSPDIGVTKEPKTWVDVGPTNRWAAFDNRNSTQSIFYGGWEFDYTPGSVVPVVAGFNITGAKLVRITFTAAGLPAPWVREIPMVDNSDVIDYWTWSWLPLKTKSEFIVTNMPFFGNAVIKMEFVGEDYVGVGSVVFGSSTYLGDINYGTKFKLLATGVEDDSVGIKVIDYRFTILKNEGGFTFRLLEQLLNKPAVFYVSENVDDGSMVLGSFTETNISIDTPIFEPVYISVTGVS